MTFKPIIYAQYRKSDGTYPVRIRITFARKSRQITTNISVTASQLTRSLKIRDAAVIKQIDELLVAMRLKAGELNLLALHEMDIDDVVRYITGAGNDRFRLDFPTFARDQIARMGAGAKNYACAVKALGTFMGSQAYDISEITSSLLSRWEAWLTDRYGKGTRAVSLYTSAVAFLHSRARELYNDDEAGRMVISNPFSRYRCPAQAPGRHRNVSPDIIAKMLADRRDLTGRERLGVDVFLISFALMGTNAPDIYECVIEDGIVRYNRRKTRERRTDRAEMRIRVEPCAKGLINEYTRPDGCGFVFARRYRDFASFGRAVNIGLHQYSARIGYGSTLTLYVARHTYATVARSSACGIDKFTVNELLCHVDADMRVTDIYAEKDWRVLWDANARVLGLFPFGAE